MANEVTDGKAVARELAARLPGWTVWYGEHTGRFWATPKGAAKADPRLAEGETPEELEAAVRGLVAGPQAPVAPAPQEPQVNQHVNQAPMAPEQYRHPVGARN
ncbi:hypothetical protein [Sphaerisporangium rhizosphaerae]|uniref:Uncharacterized protein n=1 Tax=Sphaerisporangium rhizosphaerae TaxID=2269375 RepID=A0ABW2P0D6_9ACTN